MKRTELNKTIVYAILTVIILNFSIYFSCVVVNAVNNDYSITGSIYNFSKNDNYEIDGYTGTTTTTNKSNAYGELIINGDLSSISNVDGYNAYEVNKDTVTISYNIDESKLGLSEEEWHIVEDSSKKVNGITLDSKISNGAIVLQASIDGENWITECTRTNIFSDSTITSSFYTTSDIQQLNGCYFRIIVIYKLGMKTGASWFFGVDEYSYEKRAEVYNFYLVDSESNAADAISPSATPQMNLGQKVNTGKDNGYSGEVAIDNTDPHFGWDIGAFFVNGYTRDAYDDVTGNVVFLKNVGDTVTLWFNLQQDINCLDGNSNLIISEDTNGYDQQFEVPQTNMGHGTLIIQYTDYENVAHDPVIYTDYLAANARTGADTRVQLFEEGNYAVALDYEICNKSGLDSYYNYRIYFEFEIRNGNCMVYPFDINSGNELSDMAITENGFKLDMARSRYLTIDVMRTAISIGTDGMLSEDVRFNRPAKDGDSYSDEGIYTFTVSNRFTNETTTKTIYVGTNEYLEALSKYQITVPELNIYLSEGYAIESDGTLTAPIEAKDEIMEEDNDEEIVNISENVVESTTLQVEEAVSENDIINAISANSLSDDGRNDLSKIGLIASILIVAIVLILVLFIIKKCKIKFQDVGTVVETKTESAIDQNDNALKDDKDSSDE